MPLNPITSVDDPRIAEYREVRERDIVGRRGLFIAEGAVVIDVLLRRGRFKVRSLLVLDTQVAGRAALLDQVPEDVPIYVADASVMDAIAGFPVHRGLLAIGERTPNPDIGQILSTLPADAMVLVASAIANHDNMGALFRNAAAFGVSAVLLDEACCDPLYRKAIRVSVGNALSVPFASGGKVADILDALQEAGIRVLALSPGGTLKLSNLRLEGPAALVVGAEGHGIPFEILKRVETVRIEMPGAIDSLNVATSAAIALHHLARPR
jgi:tRNA G18 (ribose-2'-O)-methylase SpoU